MATANEEIFDAMLRQQVNLQRLTQGEVKGVLTELRRADTDLNTKILRRLEASGGKVDFTTKRWQSMVEEIRRTRTSVIESIGKGLSGTIGDVAALEVKATTSMLEAAVPVEINFASPNIAAVRELASENPFGNPDLMQNAAEWIADLVEADQKRIAGAIQAGVTQGEDTTQIMRRVRAAEEMTHRNAEAITRTAVNHASNTARQEVFTDNAEVIQALRWTSTLDGRTSAICRARDGHFDSLEVGGDMENVPSPHIQGSPKRPPGHVRCRSLMIALLDGQDLADSLPERPFVRDARTRQMREKDFRKDAREKVGKERWKEMSRKERNTEIRDVRRDWADKNIGTVPGDVDYDTWLRRQPESFQDEVLGKAKAEGFRKGIKTDQYIDRQGNELTINELQAKHPSKMPDDPAQVPTDTVPKEEARQAKIAKAQADTAERQLAKDEANRIRREQAQAKAAALQAKKDAKAQLAADTQAKGEAHLRESETALRRDEGRVRLQEADQQIKGVEARDAAHRKSLEAGVDPDKALTDYQYARSLTDAQQNEVFGIERAEFLRRGGSLEQITRNGQLRDIDDMVTDFPRHVRQPDGTWRALDQDAWGQSLSADELEALGIWSGDDLALSNYQRGFDVEFRKPHRLTRPQTLDLMDDAFDRAPIYDGRVHRGIGLRTDDVQDMIDSGQFELPSYSSASVLEDQADRFAQHGARKVAEKFGDGEAVMLRVNKQRNGRMIMDETVAAEAEVLLQKGSKYKVTDHHFDKKTQTHVFDVEEIDDFAPGSRVARTPEYHMHLDEVGDAPPRLKTALLEDLIEVDVTEAARKAAVTADKEAKKVLRQQKAAARKVLKAERLAKRKAAAAAKKAKAAAAKLKKKLAAEKKKAKALAKKVKKEAALEKAKNEVIAELQADKVKRLEKAAAQDAQSDLLQKEQQRAAKAQQRNLDKRREFEADDAAERLANAPATVDGPRALEERAYFDTLSNAQQDALVGPEHAAFIRRTAGGVQRISVDGSVKGLYDVEDLVGQYPRDFQPKGAAWDATQQDSWGLTLGNSEEDALRIWGQDGSDGIVALQRGQLTPQSRETYMLQHGISPEEVIRRLDGALERAPKYDGQVWRGIGLTDENIALLQDSDTMGLPAFSSSSVKMEEGLGFARGGALTLQGQGEDAQMVLFKVKSKTGRMIMDHTTHYEEAEVILMPGTEYNILSAIWEKDSVFGKMDVLMVEIEEI